MCCVYSDMGSELQGSYTIEHISGSLCILFCCIPFVRVNNWPAFPPSRTSLPLLSKSRLVLAATSSRFPAPSLKINHNQRLEAIHFHTCHRGATLTLSVKLSNSIRSDYPIFLHMSVRRPACCRWTWSDCVKLSNSLSVLFYVGPGGVMLRRTIDAFSQLEQVDQRKYINALLMLWVTKDTRIMSFAGVYDSADACASVKTSLKTETLHFSPPFTILFPLTVK